MKNFLIDKLLAPLIHERIREPALGDVWELHYRYIDQGVNPVIAYFKTLMAAISLIFLLPDKICYFSQHQSRLKPEHEALLNSGMNLRKSERDSSTSSYPFIPRISNAEHDDKWKEFLTAFREILDPKSSTGLSVSVFLSARLRQFPRLNGLYSHADILSEVLLRAHKLVHTEGVTILEPVAWVKITGFYVICQWSRKEQKSKPLTEEDLERLDYSHVSQEVLKDDFITVNKALAKLDPDEQRLLQLRLIECLSWRDIWEYFRDEGYNYTEAALRKRKERILRKLRYTYHALKLEQITERDPDFPPNVR